MNVGDVLPLKFVSPLYIAVIESLLVGRELVVQVAVSGEPLLSVCATQPLIVVPPTSKFTAPVGVPPVPLTVAVNVTA